MEQLYHQLPYVKEFQGKVISCTQGKQGQYEVELDQTAFYPEGGGQPFDTGMIGEARVLSVQECQGRIVHKLDLPLEPGHIYEGRIDWQRRFELMQLHTGEHLVSGLIHQTYGFDNVGFHMGSEEVTIDINGVLTTAQLQEIEYLANEMVYQNLPVEVSYPDEGQLHSLDYRSKKDLSGQIRIVTIPGADCCACCGTHVGTTGEIGIIKLLSMMHYKGGVRIFLLCGRRALLDYGRRQEQIQRISNLLSAKPLLVAQAVERVKEQLSQTESALEKATEKLVALEANRYPVSDQPLFVLTEDLQAISLRRLCNLLVEQKKGNVVLVCARQGQGETYQYVLASASRDMRELSKTLNQTLMGKGGGSQMMVQGTFLADPEQIEAQFRKGCQ